MSEEMPMTEQRDDLGRRTRPWVQREPGVRPSCYAVWTDDPSPAAPAGQRNPTPAVTDDALLALSRADLVASPSQGEDHGKV